MIRNKLLQAIFLGSIGLLVAGCGGGGSANSSGTGTVTPGVTLAPSSNFAPQADMGIPFETFSSALAQSAITEKRLVAVKDANAWNRLWADHVGQNKINRPTPQIDFSKHMVIGVFLGARSACDAVSIVSVKQKMEPARIEVIYKETTPPPETPCIASLANPAVLIIVPTTTTPVEFTAAPARPAGDLVVRSGWSFGMCLDTCEGAVEIDKTGAVFRAVRKNNPSLPESALWGQVSAQDWDTLSRTFNTLPEGIIGCPDCADGGREWIEVEKDGKKKKLAFNCGAAISEAAELQATVRRIRSRLAVALGLPEVCSPGSIDFERVTPAVFTSAIEDKRFVTIRDEASWSVLWSEHAAGRAEMPKINFSQKMVLGVFLGRESKTCGSMHIESVTRRTDPDRIEVGYRVVDPGPDVMCIAAVINQYDIVTVEASPLPVGFVKLP